MIPATPLSACSLAAAKSSRDKKALNSSAMIATISGAPANSATINCQPIRTTRIIASSATRLVDASSKAIVAVKFAPLRKIERASATAAYEHDDEAAPNPQAIASEREESSGKSWLISLLETTACTTPDSAKPRINGHKISQNIANAMDSAPRIPCTIGPILAHRRSSRLTAETHYSLMV